MHLVRAMKQYGEVRVANAMYACGWAWKSPKRRPKNIERMVEGLARCDLERVLAELRRSA